MNTEVLYFENPSMFISLARDFLWSQPVLNNLFLTLVDERINNPVTGCYWAAVQNQAVIGCAMQSPLNFPLNLTDMPINVTPFITNAIANQIDFLPGVTAIATIAAKFAGCWTEQKGLGAAPVQGQRIYEMVNLPTMVVSDGFLRQANSDDKMLLTSWLKGFYDDIREDKIDPADLVVQRINEGRFYIWMVNGQPVSFVCRSIPIRNVIRIQIVYTPPQERGKGHAGNCVSVLSSLLLQQNKQVILYTDLGNPVSNFVFRKIGFTAAAECLKYRFDRYIQ